MATWTPPADAVETTEGWAPPADAVEVMPSQTVEAVQRAAPIVQPPKPGYKPTVFEEATGAVIEPIMKMGSGLIAKPISEVAGIAAMFSDYLGGNKDGDPMGFKRHVQESLTYQPRTAAGRSEYNPLNAIPEAVGTGVSTVTTPVMKALRGDSAADSARGMAANFVGEAVPQALGMVGVKNAPLIAKQVAKAGPVVGEVAADVMKNAAFTKQAAAQAASSADWQRAAAIDAAKVARENKIVMNPASVAGSGHNIKMAAAGGSSHFNTAASIANKGKWNDMVRQDLGIAPNVPLTAKTYDAVRKAVAKPYDDAVTLGPLAPNTAAIKSIRDIEIPEILPAGEQAAGKMKRVTDTVADQLENGMTGKDAVNTTRTLRKEAKAVFDSVRAGNQVDHVTVQTAKAKMAIAEKIDETISSNITDPKWKSSFDISRRKMAQTYSYERATNLVRQQVDPQVFAQEMQGRHWLTGNAAKMGEIAGNFPEIANVYAERGQTFGMPVRSGMAGTTGFAVGSLYGSPVATSAISAGLASLGEKMVGKKLRSEASQKKYATPIDRRIMPVETPKVAPQRGVVPYVSPTEVVGDMPYRPNFTRGRVDPNPTYTGPDYQQPQIGMSQGPVGGQIGALRAEDARVRETSMRQGRAAEAAQAAAEAAAPRKPTSGGMLFDLDPVTGKLRAADRGVKGATPEIWQADTGANLKSAAEKAASGQGFRMTAAEKVAWNKTAVDIKTVSSDLAKLTDKQILAKMEDRVWVQNTIDKAQQKAAMFEVLERQSQDRLAQSMARIQREKMLDVAEQLQDALGSRPSSRGYSQGPKTRAFQRGMLTGTEQ